MVNTGFVIAQNLPLTHHIFQAWISCTSGDLGWGEGYGKEYRECGKWKMEWAHEQSVFSEYLRRDFNPQGDNIVVRLNCLFQFLVFVCILTLVFLI